MISNHRHKQEAKHHENQRVIIEFVSLKGFLRCLKLNRGSNHLRTESSFAKRTLRKERSLDFCFWFFILEVAFEGSAWLSVVFVGFHHGGPGPGPKGPEGDCVAIGVLFKYLQNRSRIQEWLYE